MTTIALQSETTFAPAPSMSPSDRSRAVYLRDRGFHLGAGDREQGGFWLSRGTCCQWFADSAAAVRASERGWPWGKA